MYGAGQGSAAILGGGGLVPRNGGDYEAVQTTYAAPPAPKQAAPAVTQQIELLAKQVDHLHGVISSLESRLQVVLAPAPPTGGSAEQPASPVPSVANVLRALNARLQSAINRLNDLHDRIEL